MAVHDSALQDTGDARRSPWARIATAGAALAVVAGLCAPAVPALAAPKPSAPAAGDPSSVAFTLEGCRNDGGISLPNGSGDYICPDGAYTTGNLGKDWAELDLVPYRLTAKAGNSAPVTQDYTIAYAVDNMDDSKLGYDVLSGAVLNASLSSAACVAPTLSGELSAVPGIGGTDKTLYRTFTLTQGKGTTCVYDFYARLALGSHLYPGASLHANLALISASGGLDTGGIGARDVSIPVNEIEPQSISKEMTGSRGSDHTWNIVKQSSPASLNIANTCDVQGDYATVTLDETVTWTKNAAIPGAATLTTNISATNPSSRAITVTVNDKIFAGTDQTTKLDDTTFAPVTVPARTTLPIGTHTYVWTNPTTTSVNDVATATYTDPVTTVPIPGTTTASATATIQDNGPVSNSTAVIDDTQTISGTGLEYSIDAVTGASGSFSAYTLGSQTSDPVRWTSDAQSDSGSVTFTKTIYAAKGTIEPNGEVSDQASVLGSDAFSANASASSEVSVDTLAQLSLTKSIPAGVITKGTESATFQFDVVTADDTKASPQITLEAGQVSKESLVSDLAPGVYTVSERSATNWEPVSAQQVDLSGATCTGSLEFTNTPTPAKAQAVKVTVPAGFEKSWDFALYRGDDTTPIAQGTTDDSGTIDLGSLTEEGDYTILEADQNGWTNTADEGCSFTVDLPADGGKTFTCTRTNTFQPDITLDKTGDELSKVGDDVNYAITLANTSPTGAAAGVPDLECRVTDTPIGFDETVTIGADDSQTWNTGAFTIPSGSDPYVNEASASCTFPGLAEEVATANASWSTELFQPDVTVTKTADRDFAQVGDTVTYTITITNTGSADSPALVPDSTTPFTDSLVSEITLPSSCGSLAVDDSCSFTYQYVVQASDSTIPNTAEVLFHPAGFPNNVTDTASASLTVIHPSFTVTKTCSTPNFPPGTTAIFTVNVQNTGDVPVRIVLDDTMAGNGNPESAFPLNGTNTTATTTSDITNGDITFSGGQASFLLGVGKRAQLEISVQTAMVQITNIIAATGSLPNGYRGTVYRQTLTARDVCIDAPPNGATRTIGFWKTHLSVTRQVLNTRPLPPAVVVGTSPLGVTGDKGTFVNGTMKLSASGKVFPLASLSDVMGIFWANNAQNSNGKKRGSLCQPRVTMAKQLLGAILNQTFGNAKPLPTVNGGTIITAALAAMDGTNVQAIRDIATALETYNSSGDNTTIEIPGSLTIGKADPNAAQAMANLKAGDC